MTFGVETDEPGAHEQLDVFLEAGGTFVDTADVYGGGESERDHRPLVRRPAGRRDRPGGAGDQGPLPDRPTTPNGAGPVRPAPDPGAGRVAAPGSGSTRVDLYQVHAYDPVTPLEETLRTLDGFVRAGKIALLRAVELHRLAADQGWCTWPGRWTCRRR